MSTAMTTLTSRIQDCFGHLPCEVKWQERGVKVLAPNGYVLRPRYQPNWRPSWLGTTRSPFDCEDAINNSPRFHILDATLTQEKGGAQVAIKAVDADHRNEVAIAQYLWSEQFRTDARNHCVPIYDVLPDPCVPKGSLLVMPRLRPFNDPAFTAIGEVLDFVEQTLEGLVFLHEKGVAHRDLAAQNIVMDAGPILPNGYHPMRPNKALDGITDVQALRRIFHPVRYYFIDFGLSTRFAGKESRLVTGTSGADREPPELSSQEEYDPFALDVFTLGNVYRRQLLEKYVGLEALEPLVGLMTDRRPHFRSTAEMLLQFFQYLRRGIPVTAYRTALRSPGEHIV